MVMQKHINYLSQNSNLFLIRTDNNYKKMLNYLEIKIILLVY